MVDIDPLKLQAAALDDIASAIGRETVILPVLNGMGHFAILTCMDAFEAACKDLDGAGQHTYEVIARRIIEAAKSGERDPEKLRDCALTAFGRKQG